MKKLILMAALLAAMPLTMSAQDDLYFNPKEEAKKEAAERAEMERLWRIAREREDKELATNYCGSRRSVDEYNRGGMLMSKYQRIGTDSLGNANITFKMGRGVAPDSIYNDEAFVQKYIKDGDDDFEYTRNMSRWDGYYDPWLYDYYGWGPYYWRSSYWGWRNPWRYGYYAGWYDPWYTGWYDPWYYGYAGWYGPGYYGWGYSPWYWGGSVVTRVNYRGGFAGYKAYNNPGRVTSNMRDNANRFGRNNNTFTQRSRENTSFGHYTNTAPSNPGFSTQSSGSFGGGNRGGGSFGGGGNRGGGGGFGGHR